MSNQSIGTPRPLWKVILWSGATLLLYYGYYKWAIQDELRRYTGSDWSGAVCLLPFGLGVAIPQLLRLYDPDVPGWFGWFSLLGIAWIYIVQFRLYRTVNRLYQQIGEQAPLVVWWLFVPGLNLIVGLRQIHFLSQFWARQRGETVPDPIAQSLPILFASLLLVLGNFSFTPAAIALPLNSPPLLVSLFSFSGTRPTNLGIQAGKLAPCPDTPNCVSSFSQDASHAIAPLRYTTAPEIAFRNLKDAITALPRTQIIEATDRYLYAEFTSAIMGFVDDVEFVLDEGQQQIQVRSASRLGESDLGVNRQRIEAIRSQLEAVS